MPCSKNVFLSRPSSPPDSPLSSGRSPGSTRQLTRQRKFRHATEFDLGLQPVQDRSKSLPPTFRHWSMSAEPQPLPLPKLSSPFKASDNLRVQVNGNGKGVGEGSSLSSVTRTSTNHVASKSSKVPTYHRRGFCPENAGNAHSFRLDVPARSAPTSGFSSPVVSPQRFGSVDALRSSYSVPRELKISMDRNVVSAFHVLPERNLPSLDHSPLHSPTLLSPHHDTRNPSGVARHLHCKSLPECPAAWPEGNNSSVHPLPRPPGGPVSSHLPNISHTTNESSMNGQWQKEKLIGRGTYGSVYVAISRNDGAMCAMKEVDVIPSDSTSVECIKQLEQEIKVLQQLDHPNIVQYLGSEIIKDRFCIYLEYVYPGSINNYVREHYRSITESVVRSFTRHILSGLAYLHSINIIHRDIKGANLLVNASGVVKLADFGLAKHLTSYAVDLSLKGSPHWMAPEVLLSIVRKDSKPELAFAVDIWSVGCTVIEMLTGKPPWSEYSGVQAMFNVLNRSPAIPETLSAEGKDFLGRCFQRNPAERPTAVMLLDHPFLRNLQDQNFLSCRKDFSGLKLHGKSVSPVDRNKQNWKSISPSTLVTKGKALSTGVARANSYLEALDLQAAEVLPSRPSTYFSDHSHIMNSNASSSWRRRARKYNNHLAVASHGQEIPYL